MSTKQYEVEVVHRQRVVYSVEAPDRETAERRAAVLWRQGREGSMPGCSSSELETVHAFAPTEPDQLAQDAELVLRYLQERERIIAHLAGDLYNPSLNDAISADQVAADLGWSHRGPGGALASDVLRATRALEILCRSRRVICFERQRVRANERGEIRLYCTPDYLERLSATIEEPEQQAV